MIKTLPPSLQHDLTLIPEKTGVYIMRNQQGRVIYIGKAINLKKRVSSYFSGRKDLKTELLRSAVFNINVILCETEYEALILENNLIKKQTPRYNIMLKDGKSYPVIRITNEEYPRVFSTRNIIKDGSLYFGPFPDISNLNNYIELIRSLFKIRECKGKLKFRSAPCLYYHIKRCDAPCTQAISKEEYNRQINQIKRILSGKIVGLVQQLTKEMEREANQRNFERASQIRDQIRSLESINHKQTMEDFDITKRDYISFMTVEQIIFITILSVREGKVINCQTYHYEYPGSNNEAISEFITHFYTESGNDVPERLCLEPNSDDKKPWDLSLPLQLIREQRNQEPEICYPTLEENKKGVKNEDKLILLRSKQNNLKEQEIWFKEQGKHNILEKLQTVLNLRYLPKRIEGFDISHLDGHYTVASLVSFWEGEPDKRQYRHFKIKTVKDKPDDYQSIREAVSRRYSRLANEDQELPDLILIDGGKGQVSSAKAILEGLELNIPIVGLAKKEEIIIQPDGLPEIDLPLGHPALKLLQQVRDETHRFANNHNRRLREKSLSLNSLESIPGIGEKRSKKLLTTYGSLEQIALQENNDLAKTAGVSLEVAETMKEYLTVTQKKSSQTPQKRDNSPLKYPKG